MYILYNLLIILRGAISEKSNKAGFQIRVKSNLPQYTLQLTVLTYKNLLPSLIKLR